MEPKNGTAEAGRDVVLVNQKGLHVRAAMALVDRASKFHAEIEVEKDGRAVSAKSILGVMTLGAEVGSRLRLVARGEDVAEAVESLAALVAEKFGEDA